MENGSTEAPLDTDRFELARAMEVLQRTPETLRAMLGGLSPEWIDANEGPDTWSPRFIVAHLINGERTNWIPRARCILERGANRRFPEFDRFAGLPESQATPLDDLLAQFARLRGDSLKSVSDWRLNDAQLSLTGEHPAFGTVSLRQLLATWVVHDLVHIAQTARVMAKQYRTAVGPWRAYLPLLDR